MAIPPRRPLAALALLTGISGVAAAGGARAAQSYDSCAGFIDTLPTTISTQGVWCLRKDLSTNITAGAAIVIKANNVTIDCNDFKLGGLAAGDGSNANGIEARDRQNAVVRHCNVRGFSVGILLGGAGHLIEENRLDNNLVSGVRVTGYNNRVRRNAVYDTGGGPNVNFIYGIDAAADVIDNTVAGVFGINTYAGYTYGIKNNGGVVIGNRVSGLQPSGSGLAYGIWASDSAIRIDGNLVKAASASPGTGIMAGNAACTNNVIAGFSSPTSNCILASDVGGNFILPL